MIEPTFTAKEKRQHACKFWWKNLCEELTPRYWHIHLHYHVMFIAFANPPKITRALTDYQTIYLRNATLQPIFA